VSFPAGEPEAASARLFSTFRDVVAAHPGDAIVAVDMPIGLPERVGPSGRAPDRAARRFLGAARARVFAVPSRRAVDAFELGYEQVCAKARETSEPPRAPSKQAYHIMPRIREIDGLLIGDPDLRERVFEVRPEVAFALMNEGSALAPKKAKGRGNRPGLEHRASLLRDRGLPVDTLAERIPRGAGLDDLLDGCACAWSAGRVLRGEAKRFPDRPETDAHGLEVAIWA
jgi:predicted RNase H-like nuclease